jgi:hypothetical protein
MVTLLVNLLVEVVIVLPSLSLSISALVNDTPPISIWEVLRLLPALRSSRFVLLNDVPPIKIVLASN